MIQLLERAADRIVTAVVPKATAGACACGDGEYHFCYCVWKGLSYYRWQAYTCDCTPMPPGPCVHVQTDICL